MTNPRQEFLSALFRILEQREVPYCVLRNYQDIYIDQTSDVDLGVEMENVAALKNCLAEAAAETNHHLVLRARYVNFSYVYWHPDGGFLRIDLETEIRWRVFPVLSAKAVIALRRRHDAFYVPHPRHESVILFVACLWRKTISERYRKNLARLYAQVSGPEELKRTYRAVFGSIGDRLVEWQQRYPGETPRPRFWKSARRSVIRNAFRSGPNRRALFQYFRADVRRLRERCAEPPGISMLYAGSAQPARRLDDLFERIKFLYPSEKAAMHAYEISSDDQPVPALGLQLRLRRLYTLFKGGLFFRSYQLPRDRDIQKIIWSYSRYLYPSRTFVCMENSRLEIFLGHVKTGFMAHLTSADGAPISNHHIIHFISAILEQYRLRQKSLAARRGAFVVLVGLDGSGKTTIARNLCCLGLTQEQFARIRYFHWRPQLVKGIRFPLPAFEETPRKPELRRSAWQSALSSARLLKNLAWINLAHALHLRPLLKQNTLVLMDRYYYNYFLDPVSVKYYGPAWLLDRVRRFFPRPDLAIVLRTPPETLLARKRELSPEEIRRQSAVLERLELRAKHTVVVDAARPADEIASEIFQKIVEIAG